MYLIRGQHPKYKNNLYNLKAKKKQKDRNKQTNKKTPNNLLLKMVRGAEQTFSQTRNTDGKQVYVKGFNVTSHEGNANENDKILPLSCLNDYYQKDQIEVRHSGTCL